MDSNVPRLPGKQKKTFPMTLRIVCAAAVCAVLAGVGFILLLHGHAGRLLHSANAASEYLTAEEISVFAENRTPVPDSSAHSRSITTETAMIKKIVSIPLPCHPADSRLLLRIL